MKDQVITKYEAFKVVERGDLFWGRDCFILVDKETGAAIDGVYRTDREASLARDPELHKVALRTMLTIISLAE